jgi:hypothetical protein
MHPGVWIVVLLLWLRLLALPFWLWGIFFSELGCVGKVVMVVVTWLVCYGIVALVDAYTPGPPILRPLW